MFERYTEIARRVIFFARYEASQYGSEYIETEHLLLGLLRENEPVARLLPDSARAAAIRRDLEAAVPPPKEKTATSVDLPLSHASKRVLAYAAEESERLSHLHIGPEHLLLGLLRDQSTPAARVLERHGVELEQVRLAIASDPRNPSARLHVPVEGRIGPASRPLQRGGWSLTPAGEVDNGHFYSSRVENGAVVIETQRFLATHKITIIERLKMSDDGKTLAYSQEIQGPKQEHRFAIDFDVS